MIQQIFHTAKYALWAMAAAITFVACDPCDGVVCDNGTCANGSCVCEPGYELARTTCNPVNKRYVAKSDSTIAASVTIVDSQGNQNNYSNIAYTFATEDNQPLQFILRRFDFISDNDILLQINPQKYNVLKGGEVITAAGRSYNYSGAKVGSQVQIQIIDNQQQKTHTITYQL